MRTPGFSAESSLHRVRKLREVSRFAPSIAGSVELALKQDPPTRGGCHSDPVVICDEDGCEPTGDFIEHCLDTGGGGGGGNRPVIHRKL